MKKKFFYLLEVALVMGLLLGATSLQKSAPVVQSGEVAVTLDEHGVALVQFPFPHEFRTAPAVTLTPRGEGGFVVDRFFVDAFDGKHFTVGAQGLAGLTIKFYWVAVSQ